MSAKLAGTSLHESSTEDKPFDGQEFHIVNVWKLQKIAELYALLIIDCFLILHAASPLLQLKIKEALHQH